MNLSGRVTTVDRTRIVCGGDMSLVDSFLKSHRRSISRIIILVDDNTGRLCLPVLKAATSSFDDALVLEVPSGEMTKSLDTAALLWKELMTSRADRHTLMINLGGGMVSDLGGFVASAYQRGISYINIPTTLMAQADAAIGGKTAVNLGIIKNQIGFFFPPMAAFIFPEFLRTLPYDQIRSGFAEIIKTSLISDPVLWNKLRKFPVSQKAFLTGKSFREILFKTVTIKNSIVRRDFREKGIRKTLNFGHTVGHALESWSQSPDRQTLLHGDAVAIGIVCETYLSYRKTGLSSQDLEDITSCIGISYPWYRFTEEDIPVLTGLMGHDKKNRNDRLGFTLLESVGKPRTQVFCEEEEIGESLRYYLHECSGQ